MTAAADTRKTETTMIVSETREELGDAAQIRLTYTEVEYLMSLCLTTGAAGTMTADDALLGKLATAWRRHYRTA